MGQVPHSRKALNSSFTTCARSAPAAAAWSARVGNARSETGRAIRRPVRLPTDGLHALLPRLCP